MFGCAGIKNELDLLGIKNSGVGADVEGTNSDGLVPAVELNNSIKAVIVGYDNLISLPKLVKVMYRWMKVSFFRIDLHDDRLMRMQTIVNNIGCTLASVFVSS